MIDRRHLLAGLAVSASLLTSGGIARADSSRTVDRAGARLHVEIDGAGEPVLLLHGGLGHMGWLAELRAHLVAAGRQTILVDTRGMGRSSLGTVPLSYRVQEEDAAAVLDAVGVRDCPVIGFSDGGIVGYRMAAAANPRVTRLVTIGSRWSAENGRGMWSTFDGWTRASLSAGDFRFIVDDYDRLNPDRDFDRVMRQAAAMWKDDGSDGHPGAAIDRIQAPVLVCVGDSDPFLSVPDATAARTRIRGAHLLVIPGATHPAYRERPDIFNPALDRFLASA